MTIFNEVQCKKSEFIIKHPFMQLSDLSNSEVKELAIAWCYYSGKIEGNTYTYVETEALLKDNITSEKRYEDAKMLKNLYNTFISEIKYIKSVGKEDINEKALLRIHTQIINDLVSDEDKGQYRSRPVRISGTEYIPPKSKEKILIKLNLILYEQEQIINPLEKAIYTHCNIAKIQPFIDGNKRTARMIESIILMNNNLIPAYSIKDSDILNYRKGIVHFYETDDYSIYSDFFLNKQIERINKLSPEEQIKFKL